ncbi:MAG TPA: hypothetical protein VFL13_12165 [Candidatus Baltobacteraceae bacterium]|nr:hypothetical protein [Candidatus Baltobacteraceae bacterium]
MSRFLAAAALAALTACSTNGGNTAGQTPAPGGTTMAQANSTAAPEQNKTGGPGSKFFAQTYADSNVLFEVWANGAPVTTIQWPNKQVDITPKMRGHANNIAIRWTKLKKNGTGMLSITDSQGKKLMTAVVTTTSPVKAGITHLIMAPQANTGQ